MNTPHIIEQYLKGLQNYCYPYRGMEIRGTERIEELSTVNISLPDVFTVLEIRSKDSNFPTIPSFEQYMSEKNKKSALKALTEQIEKTLETYNEQIGMEQQETDELCRQLLFGNPGSGKTTLFNYLAYLYATGDEKSCKTITELQKKSTPKWEEQGITLKERQFPILMICREIHHFDVNHFYEYIYQSVEFFTRAINDRTLTETEKSEILAFLEAEISSHNVLLLVDGLDEIPTEQLDNFLNQLLLFLTDKTGCDSLISSRKGNREILEDINRTEGKEQQLYNKTPLYISPIFNNELKKEFAERWTRAVFQFDPSRRELSLHNFAEVLSHPSSARMIDNVLYLTIVLVLCSNNGGVPTNICELINQVIETQLSWKNEQNYHVNDVFMQLACVAYKMSGRIDSPLSIKEDELVELLITARKDVYRFLEEDVSFDSDSVKSFIRDYLVEGTGILIGKHGSFSANDEYQFRHNQFQSYLTMCAISRDYFAKKDIVEDKFSLMATHLLKKNDHWRQVAIFGVLQKGRLRDVIVNALIKEAGTHCQFLSILLELLTVYELRFDFEEQEVICKCISEHIRKIATKESKDFCNDSQINDALHQLVSRDLQKYGWIARELIEVYLNNKGDSEITDVIYNHFSKLLIRGLNWSEMPENLAISFLKAKYIYAIDTALLKTIQEILVVSGDISLLNRHFEQITEEALRNGQTDCFMAYSAIIALSHQHEDKKFNVTSYAVDLINSDVPKTRLLGINLLFQLCWFVYESIKDILFVSPPNTESLSWKQAQKIIINNTLANDAFQYEYRALLCNLARAGFISYEAEDWMTPEIFLKEVATIDKAKEVDIDNYDIKLLGSFPIKTDFLFQKNYNLQPETINRLKKTYIEQRDQMDRYTISAWYRALLLLNLFSYEEAKEEFSYIVQHIYQKTLRLECPPIEIDTCQKLGEYFSVEVSFSWDYSMPM